MFVETPTLPTLGRRGRAPALVAAPNAIPSPPEVILPGPRLPSLLRCFFDFDWSTRRRDALAEDASVSFREHGGSPAVSVPTDGPFLRKAAGALAAEWGNEAALIGSGGSIPVAGDFKRQLGLDTLLIGFAREDDRIHSPNEKYNLSSFHKGIRSWVRILAALATD